MQKLNHKYFYISPPMLAIATECDKYFAKMIFWSQIWETTQNNKNKQNSANLELVIRENANRSRFIMTHAFLHIEKGY